MLSWTQAGSTDLIDHGGGWASVPSEARVAFLARHTVPDALEASKPGQHVQPVVDIDLIVSVRFLSELFQLRLKGFVLFVAVFWR